MACGTEAITKQEHTWGGGGNYQCLHTMLETKWVCSSYSTINHAETKNDL